MATDKAEDLFQALDIDLKLHGHKYIGNCPVHGGDSYDSLNFFPDGTEGKAFWMCMSNHCERSFNGGLLGFVRGVLSHQKNGWEGVADNDIRVSNQVAIEFLCNFLNVTLDNIKPDLALSSRNKFASAVESLTTDHKKNRQGICSRQTLLRMIESPPQYYIDRGYSADILKQYDVGLCINKSSPLYGRIIVPTYSDDGKTVLGCIGRSPFPACNTCGKYHTIDESCDIYRPEVQTCKWRCSKNFNDKDHLYNYWNAMKHIVSNNRTVVIVEGCGDVWRCVEAGIDNVVALNGSDLTEPQQIALESSGATHILCLTDNDDAGESAHYNITKRCWFAKTTRIRPIGVKDVGELSPNDSLFDTIKDICQRKR